MTSKTLRIHIVTLFPRLFPGPLSESITGRALQRGILELLVYNLRDHGLGRHRVVDDYTFGGGPGMLLKPEPLFAAVEEAQARLSAPPDQVPVILLTPQGRPFTQAVADELARSGELILVCGRYEGVDERVRERLATDEISIGDYVLTGGELPALVLIDAVVRRVRGVLGSEASGETESYISGLLEGPQYTRPADFRGWQVPRVLLSGDHAQVDRWRRRQALLRTAHRRPDLLERASLTDEECRWMAEDGLS